MYALFHFKSLKLTQLRSSDHVQNVCLVQGEIVELHNNQRQFPENNYPKLNEKS